MTIVDKEVLKSGNVLRGLRDRFLENPKVENVLEEVRKNEEDN